MKRQLAERFFASKENLAPGNFRIVVAKRKNKPDAFTKDQLISAIKEDFTEAPSVSATAGKSLFYHRIETKSGKFRIFKVTRN